MVDQTPAQDVNSYISPNEQAVLNAQVGDYNGRFTGSNSVDIGGYKFQNWNQVEAAKNDIRSRAQDRFHDAQKAAEGIIERKPSPGENDTYQVVNGQVYQGVAPKEAYGATGPTEIKYSQPSSYTGGGITTTTTGTWQGVALSAIPGANFQSISGTQYAAGPTSPSAFSPAPTASYGTPNVPYGTPGILAAIARGGGPVTTTTFGPSYPLSKNESPYSTGTPNTRPVDYGYLTPGYFAAIGKNYQGLAADFANKAATAESSRQNATTPMQEAKFAVLGAGYGYGAIGSQAIGTTLQSGGRFLEGAAVGGLWKGIGVFAERNVGSKVLYKASGYGMAAIYGYSTLQDVGTAIKNGKTSQERLLGTGTVVGGTIADIGGFSVGSKAVGAVTGTPMYTQSSRTIVDVRNMFSEKPVVDYVRLPQSASVTSYAMAVGGRPASERAGRISKAELRERKSGNMQPFKVETTALSPTDTFYELRGKGVDRSLRKGEIVPTQAVKTIAPTGGVSFDIVQYKQRVGGLPVTVTADFANRPTDTAYLSNAGGVSARLRKAGPSSFDMQDNAIASRTLQNRQQVVQSFFNIDFKGNAPSPKSISSTGQEQVASQKTYSPAGQGAGAYQYGGYRYDTTKTDEALVPQYQYGSSRNRPSGIPLGSPEDRRMKALGRLRDYGNAYRDQQNKQRIAPFNFDRKINPYEEPGRPAFRNKEGLLGSQVFGSKSISGSRSATDFFSERASKNDISSRYGEKYTSREIQLPKAKFGILQGQSPAQGQLPAQKYLMDTQQSYKPPSDVIPSPKIPGPSNPEPRTPRPRIPDPFTPEPRRPILPPPTIGGGSDTPPDKNPGGGGFFLPNWGLGSSVGGKGKVSQRGFSYAPSLTAELFNIRGKKPTGRLTGFETRPIVDNNWFSKASVTGKQRRKK